MEIAFIVTAQCNAACTHCSTSCGPTRAEALDTPTIFRLMDEAAKINDGTPLRFDLTGGEAFLDIERLAGLISYGTALGGQVTVCTNGFWATSLDVAKSKLSPLKGKGLDVLAVSTSRFHQRFVPLRRVRYALEAARALGLKTELKGVVIERDLEPGGELSRWREQLDADVVDIFPVLPYLREGGHIDEKDYYREAGLPEQTCPGALLCIEADGKASCCCAPGIATDFLTLGSVETTPLEEIHRRFRRFGKQRILRELGPIHFARSIVAKGLGARLRTHYAGPCDLCLHIGSDPELAGVADEVATLADLEDLRRAWRLPAAPTPFCQ